jgi:hypothetical protein
VAEASPFAPPAAPVEAAPFVSPADTYALPSYEPVEIPPYESTDAPVVEPPAPAPVVDQAAWPEPVPSAPAWPTAPTEGAAPAVDPAGHHDHESSGWLERAKARVADIFYDPDSDAAAAPKDEDDQTH